jgi:hypothetical protein
LFQSGVTANAALEEIQAALHKSGIDFSNAQVDGWVRH